MTADVSGLRKLLTGLTLAAGAGSLAFGGADAAFSATFGFSVILLNFAFLEKFLGFTLKHVPEPGAARFITVFSFYARFGVFAAALYVFNAAGLVNFVALVAGLSAPVLVMLGWFFAAAFKADREEYGRAC